MADAPALRPAVTARLLHFSLLAGLVLFTGVSLILATRRPPATLPPVMRYFPFGFGALAFAAAIVLRGRIPPAASAASEDQWWSANHARVLVVWSLIESAALFASVIFFISGNSLFLVVTGTGLLLFILTAPNRLFER